MPRLTLDLLGPARITVYDLLLDLRVRKELALLAYLAVEQQRHRRETLLGLLWPDMPEETARNNLRGVLAGLRRGLGAAAEAALLADRQYVQFAPADQDTLDVAVFRGLLAAVGAPAPGIPTPALSEVEGNGGATAERCEACVGRLAEAAELYRGDFLAGFSLPDSAPFEDWATLQREQLHQQQLQALDTLAVAHELRGDHASQVAYARRQLVLEPWRESAHAQVMRGLWASGQRGAAIEQYEACRRILAAELGLEPSPELTALYEQLRANQLQIADSRLALPLVELGNRAVEGLQIDQKPNLQFPIPNLQSWSEAPDVGALYGRQAEMAQLEQ